MRQFLLTTALVAMSLTMSAARKTVIDRIEPTNWYVGMKNPNLQLMVYGKGIRDAASVTTDYPGVTIDSLVRLDSPNYLLVYINLKDAQPGTMTLVFKGEKERRSKEMRYDFQLKARETLMSSTCSCPTVLPRVQVTIRRSRACASTSRIARSLPSVMAVT